LGIFSENPPEFAIDSSGKVTGNRTWRTRFLCLSGYGSFGLRVFRGMGLSAASGNWVVNYRLKPPENGLQPSEIAPDFATEDRVARVLPGLSGLAHGSWVQAPPIVDPPVVSVGTRVARVDPWRIGLPWVTGSPVLSRVSNSRIHQILSLLISQFLSISRSLSLTLSLISLSPVSGQEEGRTKKEK